MAENGSAKAGRARWMRIALIASLTLNLVVIGGLAGLALGHGKHRGPMVRELGFGPYTAALSQEDRRALRDAFLAERPRLAEARRAARAEFETLVAALRAEPFDPAAVETVLHAQQARMADRMAQGQRLLLTRIGAMDPAARQGFADRLEAALRRPGPGPKDGPPPGE